MKKKFLALALTAAMVASVTGCSSKKKETEAPATEAKTEAQTQAKTEAAEEEAATEIAEAVSEAMMAAEEAVSEAADTSAEAVSEAADMAEEAVSEAADTMEEAVSEAAGMAEEAVSEAAGAAEEIEEAVSEAADMAAEAVSEAGEDAGTLAAAAATAAEALAGDAEEAVSEAAEEAEEAVSEAAEEAEEAVSEAAEEEAVSEAAEAETEVVIERKGEETNLVYATATFGQKFSPFFATTAYDMEVVDLTQVPALAMDRGGAVVYKGIEGETIDYNGTEYTYYGIGDVEVKQNDDGTVDYQIKIRDDQKFSDGEPMTIDDYIFSFYVFVDPMYDGSSTIYTLPIEGMEEYRTGMDTMMHLILTGGKAEAEEEAEEEAVTEAAEEEAVTEAAEEAVSEAAEEAVSEAAEAEEAPAEEITIPETPAYVENDIYTQEQYDELTTAFYGSMETFAQEIVDYCIGAGYNAEGDSVAACAANWGFELPEDATAADFGKVIAANYDYKLDDIEAESAGSSIRELFTEAIGGEDKVAEYEAVVKYGDGATSVKGLTRVDDYTVNLHMTQFDAKAIYDVGLTMAPLHYYGDPDQYDFENDKFGFEKGDLSGIKEKTSNPVGAGPYVFDSYANGVVTLKANENYFLGKPETEVLLMQEAIDSEYVPGTIQGAFDISVPSLNDDTAQAIKDANAKDGEEGELVGDVLHTILVDYRGYGYLGINADLVNVNDEPASEASKNLRKGFMTLMSVYRDTVINSYYHDRAAVIQYPISNTSWAAPKPADEGYQTAYSVDVDGNPIYTSAMSEQERFEAAKEAAIGFFKAAGYTYDEASGTFTDFDKTYEVMIPGSGLQDHPAYGIAVAASEVLAEMGITLQVNDVGTSTWNNALESNTAMMWAAAWQATPDPDMTQVYHSDNAHGNGTNSNHYAIDDAELDELIADGKSSPDTEYRKSVYKQAMDIIMDWGCELPLYQRKDCTVASAERVAIDTLPQDMTPYWGWYAEVNTLALQ